jgi:hypothetical protein
MPKNKNQKIKPQKKNRKRTEKKKYKVRNWSEYNEALKKRGMLDVYMEKNVLEEWYENPEKKKKGAQTIYSDLAIQITLQFGKVFSQKLRQTEGLLISLFKLMKIDLKVPDFSTLSRRGCSIKVNIPKDEREKVVLAVDSSGLKVYGEGEWKVRKHGYSKRRTWIKIHLAVTPDGEFRAVEITGNNVSDDETVEDMLNQETAKIDGFAGDGAYDKRKVYDACQSRGIKNIMIPPRINAKIWQHGNSKKQPHPRDENLRQIRKTSMKKWKKKIGYHVRSLSETGVFRYKKIFGDKLNARDFRRQKTEVLIGISILNKMKKFGMPNSCMVT